MHNKFYSDITIKTAIAIAVARQAVNQKQSSEGDFIHQAYSEAGSGHGERTLKGAALNCISKVWLSPDAFKVSLQDNTLGLIIILKWILKTR